ncbi:MAG: hypothetical protein RLO18_13680, partial [Gimesia chilikensis]
TPSATSPWESSVLILFSNISEGPAIDGQRSKPRLTEVSASTHDTYKTDDGIPSREYAVVEISYYFVLPD